MADRDRFDTPGPPAAGDRGEETLSATSQPRYSARPLPPYRHVPGLTPHPLRDPEGHSFGRGTDPETLPDLNHSNAIDCDEMRYGADLFNDGYWWECHEVCEGLWRAAGPGTPAAHVLQAIIQCAAAHLKMTHDGPSTVAEHLFIQAERHIHEAAGVDLDLDLVGLLAETGAYVTADSPEPARLVFSTT